MSDQFVLNVRQIMDYPLKPAAAPGDAVLMQTGGLGGPYVYTTAYGVAQALGGPDGQVGIGVPLPLDAVGTGVLASNLITPLGCTQGWNWYVNSLGEMAYLTPGAAAVWCFDGSTLHFNVAPGGSAGMPIASSTTPFSLDTSGNLTLTGTVTVAGDPTAALEVATKEYVDNEIASATAAVHDDSVWSFNGRNHAVTLALADITGAGGAPLASPAFTGTPSAPSPNVNDSSTRVATTLFVQQVVAASRASSVLSFNGRYGDVVFAPADLSAVGGAFLNSPVFSGNPQAPTPGPGSNDTSIATTAYVTVSILNSRTSSVLSWNGRTGNVVLTLADITGAGGAPIDSPAFTGVPTAPTAPVADSTATLATTAFVMRAIVNATAGVATWNGRTGAVVMTLTDILNAGGAPLDSPQFTGTPTAPTPPVNDVSMRVATTAFVNTAIANGTANIVTSWNGRIGAVLLQLGDVLNVGGAPINSPEFQGVPSTPYPPFNSSDTTIPNTQWVQDRLSFWLGEVVLDFNNRKGHVTLNLNDVLAVGGAPIASPAFTGIPTAPTAPAWTNTAQIATTAFVLSQIEKTIPEQGPPGPAGPQGLPGQGFQILASVPTASALPAAGNQPGDVRIAEDSGIGYVWEVPPGAWSAIGQLQGPPGTLPDIGNNEVLGNVSGFFGPPVGLSQAQLTALVNVFTPTLRGAVPPSGPAHGPQLVLRGDATWGEPLTIVSVLGNVDANIPAEAAVVTAPAINPSRTWTLPPIASVPQGHRVQVIAYGIAAGQTLTVQVSGAPGSPDTAILTQGPTGNLVTTDHVTSTGAVVVWSFLADGNWVFSNATQFSTGAQGAVPASPGGTTAFLRADGSWAAPVSLTAVHIQTFPGAGPGTYTPTPGTRLVFVECWAGGGSGGVATSGQRGAGGGGGCGGYTSAWLTAAQIGASQGFTVGAGGLASASAAGGNTQFGTTLLLSANGGGAGENYNGTTTLGRGGNTSPPGTLGAGVNGYRFPAYPGGPGIVTSTLLYGGQGAGAGAGRQVVGTVVTVGAAVIGSAVGAGGGGSISDGSSSPLGGDGAPGLIKVTEFIYG